MFLRQALGLDLTADAEAMCRWFFSDQKSDGSWGIASDNPGDVSTSVEAYLALRLLSVPATNPAMLRARQYILSVGGVAKVRVFTRMYLATFGLFPWSAVPQLPAELILMPPSAPINIYFFSSWARSTIVPLLIVIHHQPIFALPNGKMADNDFIDDVWCDATNKMVPYIPSYTELFKSGGITSAFAIIDKILILFGGLRNFPLRDYSRRKCMAWILEHQEESGDWAGIFPAIHHGILALVLEDYCLTDSPVRRGLEAVERFVWQDCKGKRVQACVSPVWDTVLTVIGLCDAGVSGQDERLTKAMDWVRCRQQLGPEGDWRIYRPGITPGGWSFEYYNTWYPDVDDTAAVLLAFLKQNPESRRTTVVIQGTEWVLGMQNKDGGFAAFDYNNNKVFLNKIPFSDMNSLSDPSTADVTGRVLEAFGLLLEDPCSIAADFEQRILSASQRALTYLSSNQESTGAWYGRWGANYVYGTSNVLCGLAYFSENNPRVQSMVGPAIRWLKSVQNVDGGWGEELITYKEPAQAGRGTSTASQTAWGLMGLLAHLPSTDQSIRKGIAHLILTQTTRKGGGASWPETKYTGTGFPGFLYLSYELYAHYFPLMALGRFVQSHALHEKNNLIGEKKQKQVHFPVIEKPISATSRDDLSPESFEWLHGGSWMTGVLFASSLSLLCRFWQFTYKYRSGEPDDGSFFIFFLVHLLTFFLTWNLVFFLMSKTRIVRYSVHA